MWNAELNVFSQQLIRTATGYPPRNVSHTPLNCALSQALEKSEVLAVMGLEGEVVMEMDVNKVQSWLPALRADLTACPQDYKVTIEEWMRYFNNQWEFMPDSVFNIIEVTIHPSAYTFVLEVCVGG